MTDSYEVIDESAYVLADGDDVGDRIELFLLRNQPDSAAALSASIESAIRAVAHLIQGHHGAVIVYVGGDELLARLPRSVLSSGLLDAMRSIFREQVGCGLSIGIGVDARSAALGLRIAKLSGKDQATINGLNDG
jgi:GTP cyclohydrolase III